MKSRILKAVIDDIEQEWLVPNSTFISWVQGQLVIKSTTIKLRTDIQVFLRQHNVHVTELIDSKELIVDPLYLDELSLSEANITTSELLDRLHEEEL